jgi:hypothetical protein
MNSPRQPSRAKRHWLAGLVLGYAAICLAIAAWLAYRTW